MNEHFPSRTALAGASTDLAGMVRRDTIVIGASSGGVAALSQLLGALPANLPAAVFVVLHQMPGRNELADVLRTVCRLPIERVDAPRPIRNGMIYLAPPDRHMVLAHDEVRPADGPHEMRTRPAINPLFRTAASARGARVLGVQLTGLLDDGVAGLAAIQRCGGLVLVQDPGEAAYPDMPRNAIDAVTVDHVAPLDELAARLKVLVHELARPVAIPSDIALEARLVSGVPAVGGDEDLGRSLLVAIQALGERTGTLTRMAASSEQRHPRAAAAYRERAAESDGHVQRLRDFLDAMTDATSPRPIDDAPERVDLRRHERNDVERR